MYYLIAIPNNVTSVVFHYTVQFYPFAAFITLFDSTYCIADIIYVQFYALSSL